MYGMVNQAVKGLVEEKFGSETWTRIHTKANAPETYSAMQPYDDAITYNLVGAASEVLQLPPEAILHTFGEYWVLSVATKHYGALMNSTGNDFVEFVRNLDMMHDRMRQTFPTYSPPSFRVKELEAGLLQIDYYSKREGLMPFVEGLFSGLGKHFGLQLQFEHVPRASHPLPCERIRVRYQTAL